MWAWFIQLASSRGSNGFGPNPISYQDLLAWSLLTGTIIRSGEVEAIMMLDRLWLAMQAKHQAADRPNPAAPKVNKQ